MKHTLYEIIQRGFRAKQAARTSEGGDWRGGNSGCLTEDGIFLGTSPQKTVLRHLGIEMKTTLDDDLMFEGGFKNEEHWQELLGLGEATFKCEEEIPVVWELPNGQTITGRPDIVVGENLDSEFVPTFGIELKQIAGNGSMMEYAHFAGATPNSEHVCQSAHYSREIGVPWVLAYTSRVWFFTFMFKASRFKFEHRAMRTDGEKVITVSPFISLYDVSWDSDIVMIDDVPTKVSGAGITRYYQYCSDCVANGIIPELGGGIDVFGNTPPKNKIELYNDYVEADTSSFEKWVEDCRCISEEI